MPRIARTIFAHIPHHITQRGNSRSDVFFTDDDYISYLSWLKEYIDKHQVEVLAYCLMTNHVHIVAVPCTDEGLHRVFRPLHMRYARTRPLSSARRPPGALPNRGAGFHARCHQWAAIRY